MIQGGYPTVCPYVDHTDVWRALASVIPFVVEYSVIGAIMCAVAYIATRKKA